MSKYTGKPSYFCIGELDLDDAPYYLHEGMDNFTNDEIMAEMEAVAINCDVSGIIEVLWQQVHDNLYAKRKGDDDD